MQTTLENLWLPNLNSKKLIVVAHGRGDSYDGFRWLPDALDLSVNYLMVNAPDDYFGGFSWYDLAPNQEPGILRSRHALQSLFLEIIKQGFSSEDILYFGFSQGCLMALEWGGRTSIKLAGFVGISGYVFDEQKLETEKHKANQSTPWLITHGTKDSALPYHITEKQIQYLKDQGWPIQFETFVKDHTIDPQDEIPLLKSWIKKALVLE
jgi:phospholipase/carboxylesterase